MLQNFKRHPIALFNHDIDKPIGLWENVRVERGALRGHLKLAPQGTSQRIAEMHALFDARRAQGDQRRLPQARGRADRPARRALQKTRTPRMLARHRASQPERAAGGEEPQHFRRHDALVFGVPANEPDRVTRGTTGVPAVPPPARKPGTMEPIAKKIEAAQQKLDDLKNQLTAHLDQAGDEPDDVAQTVTEELNGKIASTQRNLENLTEAERQIGSRAVQVAHERKALDGDVLPPMRRPFAAPAEKEPTPSERVLRVLVGHLVAGARRQYDPTVTPLAVHRRALWLRRQDRRKVGDYGCPRS